MRSDLQQNRHRHHLTEVNCSSFMVPGVDGVENAGHYPDDYTVKIPSDMEEACNN